MFWNAKTYTYVHKNIFNINGGFERFSLKYNFVFVKKSEMS